MSSTVYPSLSLDKWQMIYLKSVIEERIKSDEKFLKILEQTNDTERNRTLFRECDLDILTGTSLLKVLNDLSVS